MPILHLRPGADPDSVEGTVPQESAADALIEAGARVRVRLSLVRDSGETLGAGNPTAPWSVTGWALLDTGASTSCVDEAAARELRLPVVGTCEVTSATQAFVVREAHPVRIEIVDAPLAGVVPQAIAAPLGAHGLVALIGRDLLGSCCLVYNGLPGEVTLCV